VEVNSKEPSKEMKKVEKMLNLMVKEEDS